MKPKFDAVLITPYETVNIREILFFRGEDRSGTFGILPKHCYFITVLEESVAIFKYEEKEEFFAFNKGILVFKDNFLKITTREFIRSDNLENLKTEIEKRFSALRQKENIFRENLSKLEKAFMQKLIELEREVE
ncbi:hypothetical protein [Nitrosophilus alvini]|uniref:hypothetical protein n=1 Tax=Nitrosophilus alvini TaxID=2714855 RepID=UPI00190DD29D|nr:hypothetical protein [Nitrosophilus alvini]